MPDRSGRRVTLADVRGVPGVADAERLDLRPGDVVVARLEPGVGDDGCAEAVGRLAALLDGTGVKVIAVEGGAVDVLRGDAAAE